MDIGTISSRYARALFSLAKERGVESRIYEDMQMLATNLAAEPALKEALANPIIPEKEKERLLTTAAGIEVDELFARFLRLVLQHKRESLLLFMAPIYMDMCRTDKHITRAQFSTAVPATEQTRAHVEALLREKTGGAIEFVGRVQPELIGGFVLRIDNYRIDASYKTQLSNIRNQLLERK
ncbi:MAG: F0F1 ATP synthase subunit delta [Tannerellaceae bacterium]